MFTVNINVDESVHEQIQITNVKSFVW